MNEKQYFLQELRNAARRKGADLNDLFQEYDKNDTGCIPYDKFRAILSSISFWCEEQKLQDETYSYCEGKFFYYKRFLQELSTSQPTPTISEIDLKKFGQFLAGRGTCVIDIARPFDPYRSGRISAISFCESAFHYPLAKTIVQPYIIPGSNDFEYVQLARDVQAAMSKNIDLSSHSPDYQKLDLPPFFSTVSQSIRDKGIDIVTNFSHYDRYHQGKISSQQFLSEISRYGIPLQPKELAELAQIFSVSESPNFVDYQRFCEEIQRDSSSLKHSTEIPQNSQINQNNQNSLNPQTNSFQNSRSFQNSQNQSFRNFQNSQILNQSQNQNSSNQLPSSTVTAEQIIKPFVGINTKRLQNQFEYDDFGDSGYITSNAFFRALSLINLIPSETEKHALLEKYQNPQNGRIDYNRFLADLQDPQKQEEKSKKTELFNQVIAKIKQYLHEQGIQLRPIFKKHDKSYTGRVPLHFILEELELLRFDLTAEDAEILHSQYKDDASIDQFCQLVDPTDEEIQILFDEKQKAIEEEKQKNIQRPPIPDQRIISALAAVCYAEKRFNFDLRQECRLQDSLKKGTVKQSFFRNILLSLPPCPELSYLRQNVDDLSLFYGLNQVGEVKYEELCSDKNEYGLEEFNKIEQARQQISTSSQTFPNEDLILIKKIKGFSQMKMLDLVSLFQSYDITHCGELSPQRFASAMKMIGPFSQQEVERVYSSFPKYRRLYETVESTILTPEDLISIKVDPQYSGVSQRDVNLILITIREKLSNRRRKVIDAFSFAQSPEIPVNQFREAIESFDLVLRMNDIQLLIKKYRANLNGDINWQAFCQDVEASRTIQYGY